VLSQNTSLAVVAYNTGDVVFVSPTTGTIQKRVAGACTIANQCTISGALRDGSVIVRGSYAGPLVIVPPPTAVIAADPSAPPHIMGPVVLSAFQLVQLGTIIPWRREPEVLVLLPNVPTLDQASKGVAVNISIATAAGQLLLQRQVVVPVDYSGAPQYLAASAQRSADGLTLYVAARVQIVATIYSTIAAVDTNTLSLMWTQKGFLGLLVGTDDRLLAYGGGVIAAVTASTGAVQWKTTFPGGGTYGVSLPDGDFMVNVRAGGKTATAHNLTTPSLLLPSSSQADSGTQVSRIDGRTGSILWSTTGTMPPGVGSVSMANACPQPVGVGMATADQNNYCIWWATSPPPPSPPSPPSPPPSPPPPSYPPVPTRGSVSKLENEE
jgi:hypothetical protein